MSLSEINYEMVCSNVDEFRQSYDPASKAPEEQVKKGSLFDPRSFVSPFDLHLSSEQVSCDSTGSLNETHSQKRLNKRFDYMVRPKITSLNEPGFK